MHVLPPGSSHQTNKADNLYCTLMNQDRHQDLIWHSEADADKFYNTREWIQIIADETSMKLADIKSVMSLPGTPRPRQADSHGQQTLPPPGSFPRQHQTETLGAGSKWHPTTNTVKRKLIYSDDQRHSHPAEMGPAHPTNGPKDRPLKADRTAHTDVNKKTPNTHVSSRTIPRLMDIHIPHALPPSTPRQPVAHRKYQPGATPSRKRNLQMMVGVERNPKKRREHDCSSKEGDRQT